jgi:Ca2+-binding EF-hand superfamily protein
MAALAASGLGHHDRVVRDVCFKIKARIDQLGMTPSETFLRIDAQRDGLLTHDEVRDGFNRMGVVLSDNEMAAVVKAVDKRGTGIVDRGGLVTALFPPDADVMEATAGTEHAAIAAEARASGVAVGDNTAHRPHRRMAPVSLRQSLSSPQVQAAKMAETAEALDSSAAGIGRSKLDEDFFDHDDLVATGADQIDDSWVRSERVDEAGMYTTGRDAALADMNPTEFRRREFHKPPPHYNLAVPRDAHGTTAPFLARAGQVGEDGAQLGDGHDVGFAELAASHGPLPTKKLAARKKQNALLRRVFRSLEAKGGRDAARRLFMRVNVNHDAKVEYKELREGLARDGVALTDPEFRMLMNRLDSDRNGAINYSELARAMKQDDPLPDETDEHLAGTGVRYRPNRYNPPPGMALTPGQGAPRVTHDSRGVRAAIDGLEAPAVAAATLEEARMSQEVVDRMRRKRASLRQTWLRVKDAASSTIAAGDLRKRLVDAGVTVSDKQVRAFLTGGGSKAMPQQVSFSQFVELARPRAFVDDPRRLGRVSALQPRLRTVGRPNDVEGIGRFGAAPQPPRSDEVPGYLADYGFKTNTDPAGIMDPEGRMDAGERAEADREADQAAREAADGERRDDAALGVGGEDGHRPVERHAQSPAARRKSGVFRAAMQEHAGLPAAGTLMRRFQGRGVVADGPYHAYRLWSGDRVRDMLGGGGGVHVVAQDDFDVGRVSFTTTRAEQRRRRRRHSIDVGSGTGPAAPAPPAGVVSGVFSDLDVARKDLDKRAPAFAQTYTVPASPVVRERIARAAAAAQGPTHPARRRIAFAGDDTDAAAPQRSVRTRRPPPPPRPPATGNGGREPGPEQAARQFQQPVPAGAGAGGDSARFHRVDPHGAPAARAAGVGSSITSPVAQASRAGRRHFVGASGGIRDQHHSDSGIFSSFGYGDYQPTSKRMGSHHALKPMGHF